MVVPRFEPITTERLVVRPMESRDGEALWVRRNDPATAQFQNWTLPYARERAQELIDEIVALDGIAPGSGWLQLSVDDAADGTTIGDIAIGFSFDGRCAELGWTIATERQGTGIATEAASAVAAWLFGTVGVTRVSAMMHPDNSASVRVAERLGMVFEGHTRNSYWVGEENSDDWIFGVTADSWRTWTGRSRQQPDGVTLVEITRENLEAVEGLATHRSQERFVATMAGSFADAFVARQQAHRRGTLWLRAVEADGEIVGFVMVAEPSAANPNLYLGRLLVDRLHQRRGIGGRVVDLVIERARSLGAVAVDVSWAEGPGSPAPLYRGRGFEPTGVVEDGETAARLELTAL